MKIVNMSVSNYRQFKYANINFDDGITVLAGANNSGKTSLITLIKNIFTKEKMEYGVAISCLRPIIQPPPNHL